MSALQTTATISQALREGLEGFIGTANKTLPQQWVGCYEERSSEKAYEEQVEISGLGYAPSKPEGSPVLFGKLDQGGTSRATHKVYAYGIAITEEAFEDGRYAEVAKFRGEAVGKALANTKNVEAMLPFNEAFTTNRDLDGVPLISASHPLANGGTDSNLISSALTEKALEDMVIRAKNLVQQDGTPMIVMPKMLVVPIALEFAATKILESQLQSDSANNTINALKFMGSIPSMKSNRFLTDNDAFFLMTDVPGAVFYNRRELRVEDDNEFSTSNKLYSASERYSFKFHDYRAILGSQGA